MAERKAAPVETDRAARGPVETAGGSSARQESGVRQWQGDSIIAPPPVTEEPADDEVTDDAPDRP